MTTVALLAAAAVAATSLGLALMLCVAAARADRRLRGAVLDMLGWPAQEDWARDRQQSGTSYEERAAS